MENLSIYYNINPVWYDIFAPQFREPYFKKLAWFVENERSLFTVYPPVLEVWSWTWHCHYNDIKVINVGQDPYCAAGQAHGVSWSVPLGVPVTRCLNNIFHELQAEVPNFEIPQHGNLIGWAQQGVLLLNMVLTIREGEQKSHRNQGWEKFIDSVLDWFNEHSPSMVFMLWGNHAQKTKVNFHPRHLVLTAPHPSPLSASKGYFGCDHFSKTNQFLQMNNKGTIDWNYLPPKLPQPQLSS